MGERTRWEHIWPPCRVKSNQARLQRQHPPGNRRTLGISWGLSGSGRITFDLGSVQNRVKGGCQKDERNMRLNIKMRATGIFIVSAHLSVGLSAFPANELCYVRVPQSALEASVSSVSSP